MPQNLERDFQKAVLKLKHKNKNILRQKTIVFLLTFSILAGLLYFIFRHNPIFATNANIMMISVIILIIISSFYLTNIGVKSKLHSHLRAFRFQSKSIQSNRFKFFKSIKTQHWVILLILLLSANTHLIKDLAIRVGYNPIPHSLASPWPWKNNEIIHPIIANITPDIENSIKSVAEYIARQESDPYLQVKALHDYVINRVSYDFHALEIGIQPPQDAQTVFSTRKAVCGGYANLFVALGRAIGIDVIVVQGNIRLDLAPPTLNSTNIGRLNSSNTTLHAWNAVKIADSWQLVDTTWDDSNSNKNLSLYKSDYLMPPPKVMITDHLPEQSDWQLLSHPIDRSYFERQLILKPRFLIENLQMISPVEYKTSVQREAFIQIKIPLNHSNKIVTLFSEREKQNFSLWSLQYSSPFSQDNQTDIKTCQNQSSTGKLVQISCQFSGTGIYQVLLFSSEQRDSIVEYRPIAQLKFDVY